MAKQLIYTSAKQGIRPDASGYCTVLSTQGITRAQEEYLESLSVFAIADQVNGESIATNGENYNELVRLNPPAVANVKFRYRNQSQNVLLKTCLAGFDYSNRLRKLSHFLLLDEPDKETADPAAVVTMSGLFADSWDREPVVLDSDFSLPGDRVTAGQCRAWERFAGDGGWAGELVRAMHLPDRPPVYIYYDASISALPLLREALALIPAGQRWNATFSTNYAGLPSSVDCQWRFVPSSSPAAEHPPEAIVINLNQAMGVPPESEEVAAARAGEEIVHEIEFKSGLVDFEDMAAIVAAQQAEAETERAIAEAQVLPPTSLQPAVTTQPPLPPVPSTPNAGGRSASQLRDHNRLNSQSGFFDQHKNKIIGAGGGLLILLALLAVLSAINKNKNGKVAEQKKQQQQIVPQEGVHPTQSQGGNQINVSSDPLNEQPADPMPTPDPPDDASTQEVVQDPSLFQDDGPANGLVMPPDEKTIAKDKPKQKETYDNLGLYQSLQPNSTESRQQALPDKRYAEKAELAELNFQLISFVKDIPFQLKRDGDSTWKVIGRFPKAPLFSLRYQNGRMVTQPGLQKRPRNLIDLLEFTSFLQCEANGRQAVFQFHVNDTPVDLEAVNRRLREKSTELLTLPDDNQEPDEFTKMLKERAVPQWAELSDDALSDDAKYTLAIELPKSFADNSWAQEPFENIDLLLKPIKDEEELRNKESRRMVNQAEESFLEESASKNVNKKDDELAGEDNSAETNEHKKYYREFLSIINAKTKLSEEQLSAYVESEACKELQRSLDPDLKLKHAKLNQLKAWIANLREVFDDSRMWILHP